jgi:hypothetical protein
MGIAEGDLGRVLNALTATLNDQAVESVDPERFQEIVTGALGGEEHLRVTTEGEPADGAALLDTDGRRVARLKRTDGTWTTERIVDAQIADSQVPEPPAS